MLDFHPVKKSAEHTVSRREDGWPLHRFLSTRLSLSRRKAKSLLDDRRVLVNSRRTWMARHLLRAGDRIRVNAPVTPSAKLKILWRDDSMLVLDKPPGILSNGKDSLEALLRSDPEFSEWLAVHRLDRDTSGCLLFAASPLDKERVVKQFRANTIRKVYQAIVLGRIPTPRASVKTPLEEKKTVTRFEVLDANRTASHIRIDLQTGRTHQIRKHVAELDHPVIGDKTYNAGARIARAYEGVPRQMLHARSIGFRESKSNKEMRVTAPLPADFRRTLRLLRLT